MKKFFKILAMSALLLSLCIVATPQKTTASPAHCKYGQYHTPNGRGSIVKAEINGKIINGTCWTCSCGSEVVTTDVYRYFYPSDNYVKKTPGYPYTPGSIAYYTGMSTYSGLPSEWTGIVH